MELVAAPPFRLRFLLVREDREVLRVRSLGTDDLVVQDVALDPDLVVRDDRALGIAEQAGVHEREVAEVGEVLDLAGRVALPAVRAAGDGLPGLELRDLGERPARLLERDPDEAVALLAAEGRRPGLLGDAGRVGELRDRRAGATRPVPPAVVGTDDFVPLDGAERERSPAVNAEIGERVSRSIRVAPEHERLREWI